MALALAMALARDVGMAPEELVGALQEEVHRVVGAGQVGVVCG